MKIFKVYVNTYGETSGSFTTNSMEYLTKHEAQLAAEDLFLRWTAVKSFEIREEESRKEEVKT